MENKRCAILLSRPMTDESPKWTKAEPHSELLPCTATSLLKRESNIGHQRPQEFTNGPEISSDEDLTQQSLRDRVLKAQYYALEVPTEATSILPAQGCYLTKVSGRLPWERKIQSESELETPPDSTLRR